MNTGVTVADILQWCPNSSSLWDKPDFLETLLAKDQSVMKIWLEQQQFDALPDNVLQQFLMTLNKQKWTFSPQQWNIIESRFNALMCNVDATFMNQTKNENTIKSVLLCDLIDSIASNEKLAKCLHALREHIDISIYEVHEDTLQKLKLEKYTPLHLLIARRETSSVLRLLDNGADWKKEVVASEASFNRTNSIYSDSSPKTMSALELAKLCGLVNIVKHIQCREAQRYLTARESGPEYTTKLSMFGFSLMNFGFPKHEKILAAQALVHYLENGVSIPESCRPALSQGQLPKFPRN